MTASTPRRSTRRALTSVFHTAAAAALLAGVAAPAWAQDPPPSRCSDERTLPPAQLSAKDTALLAISDSDPRAQLQELVQRALARSKAIGAVRLLTQSAEADLAEAKAQRLPTVTLGLTAGHTGTILPGDGPGNTTSGMQGRGSVSVSAPLWDSGRITKLTE